MHGKTFLMLSFGLFYPPYTPSLFLRPPLLLLLLLPRFGLSFLSLFYKSAPLPLISSPFTSSTTLFFFRSLFL